MHPAGALGVTSFLIPDTVVGALHVSTSAERRVGNETINLDAEHGMAAENILGLRYPWNDSGFFPPSSFR